MGNYFWNTKTSETMDPNFRITEEEEAFLRRDYGKALKASQVNYNNDYDRSENHRREWDELMGDHALPASRNRFNRRNASEYNRDSFEFRDEESCNRRNAIENNNAFGFQTERISIQPSYQPTSQPKPTPSFPECPIKTGYCKTLQEMGEEYKMMSFSMIHLIKAIADSKSSCDLFPGYTGEQLILHLSELRHVHNDVPIFDGKQTFFKRLDPCRIFACGEWNVDLTVLVEALRRNKTLKKVFLTLIDEDHHYIVLDPLYSFLEKKPATQIEVIYINAQQIFYQPVQCDPPRQYVKAYMPVFQSRHHHSNAKPILIQKRVSRRSRSFIDSSSYDTPVTTRTPEQIEEEKTISGLIENRVWNYVEDSESDGYDTTGSDVYTSCEEA